MDEDTRVGILSSIEKWEHIVNGTGVDDGTDNCALCKEFHKNGNCTECPVVTIGNGRYGCFETPYSSWRSHHNKTHFNHAFPLSIECEKCKELAQKELDFLKSLL